MKGLTHIILFLFVLMGIVAARAQESTTQKLPQIQLKEYTIVGLEKVVLPRKERQPILKQVKIQWVANPIISRKLVPRVDLNLIRKPFLKTLPRGNFFFQGQARYASFNTLGLNLRSQLVSRWISPYWNLNYARSDGHVKHADWSRVGFKLGMGNSKQRNTFFDYSFVYHQNKNGIYGALNLDDSNREVVDTDWQVSGVQQIKLHNHLYNYWQIHYRDLERTAFIKNKLKSLDAGTQFIWGIKDIQIHVTGGFHSQVLKNFSWQQALPLADSSQQKTTLADAKLSLVYQKSPFELQIGGMFQSATRNILSIGKHRNKWNPLIAFSLRLAPQVKLFARYNPEFRLPRLPVIMESFPYANALLLNISEYKNQISGGVSFSFGENNYIKIKSNYSRVESYPIAASSQALRNWVLSYINEGKIQENSLFFSVSPFKNLNFNGWLTLRNTEVKQYLGSGDSAAVTGSQFPYQAQAEGAFSFRWQLHRKWVWQTELMYEGERFNDILNREKLSAYWLLNVYLKWKPLDYIQLNVFGKNILNKKYDQWYGLESPPLWGGFEIEFRR